MKNIAEFEMREALLNLQEDLFLQILEFEEIESFFQSVAQGSGQSAGRAKTANERRKFLQIQAHFFGKFAMARQTRLALENNRSAYIDRLRNLE